MLTTILAVLVAAICIFVSYFKWCLQYWNRKHLNNFPGTIPFGTIENPGKSYHGFSVKRIYHEMRAKGWRHGGIYFFASPMYLVLDLDYVKNVLTADFQYFSDRGFYYNEKDDPISAHLLAVGGTKWKNLHKKLTPTFTSGKMKIMFPTLLKCLDPLIQTVEEHIINKTPIDIREVTECFTTNVIGSCGFGLECNAFAEPNLPFRVHGKKFFKSTKFRHLKIAFASCFKEFSRFLGIVSNDKETSEFFFGVVEKIMNYRENNNVYRPDFMQLLINMKNDDGTKLTCNEIVSLAFIFFLGGFETTAILTTFALYELAANQDIQDKVREEVNRVVTKHGEITYEALHEMKYMGQVIDETLRKYPPAPFITRECVKDYNVPGEDVVIEKGTRVGISIMGIHYDSEYYPEPEKFDPERFSDENKRSRNQYAHIPFGEGPRLCIGYRFGIMQAKVGLASLLRSYKFTVNKKTEEPIQFELKSMTLTAKNPILLNAHKI